MIDDFADRSLILRNLAIVDEPSKTRAFNEELSKHRAYGASDREIYTKNRGESAPLEHTGTIVETYGHIRSTRMTVELSSWGAPEFVDFQRIELLDLNGHATVTLDISADAEEVTVYGEDKDCVIARVSDYDDPIDRSFEVELSSLPTSLSVKKDEIDYSSGKYDSFRQEARIVFGPTSVVNVTLTTPMDSGSITYVLDVDVQKDGRLKHSFDSDIYPWFEER